MNVTKGKQFEITVKAAKMVDGRQPVARLLVEITKATQFSCSYKTVKVLSGGEFGFNGNSLEVGGFALTPEAFEMLEIKAA
jgi:hypothetical protein